MFNRQLEVPYNFDKELIAGLKILDKTGTHIHCIYSAPYRPDYRSAKYNYTHGNGVVISKTQEMTREEYEGHIKNINDAYPRKLMLLLQQNGEEDIMQKDMLSYYMKLGFTKFCVGSILQAKLIKELNPFCEITASISMKLEPEDLENKELQKYFSNVVLWFPYNRDLEKINSLPNYFKYILLVNCTCNIKCDGTHHWFASLEGERTHSCPNQVCRTLWDEIIIRPTDLPLFNKISYFKLQGREYLTEEILYDFVLYTTDKFEYLYRNLVDRDLYIKKEEPELALLELEAKKGIDNTYREYDRKNISCERGECSCKNK